MDIIARIKKKLSTRRTDNATEYWQTIERLAAGKLSQGAAEAAVDALAGIAELLGKGAIDIEADLGLLQQRAEVEQRATGLAAAEAELKTAVKGAAAAHARAEQLRSEAAGLVRDAEANRARAAAKADGIRQAGLELRAVRQRLAAAGHPVRDQVAAEQAEEQRGQRIRQLEVDLAAVGRDLAELDRAIQNNRTPAPEMQAHHGELLAKRDQLEEQLAQVRGAAAEVGS